jgi:hypothetical protein
VRRPALLLLAVALVGTATGAHAARRLPVGCDGRAALVHQAGAGHPGVQQAWACSTSTGYATAESHISVLPDGTVVMTPAVLPQGTLGIGQVPGSVLPAQSNASPAALAVSRDRGAHWSLVKPSGTTWNPTDHGDYVDPVTGRWFFESYGPIPLFAPFGADQEGPSHLEVSADHGRTWAHSVLRDTQVTENAQFTAAPPPRGGDVPVGYPRVTYFCANISIGFTSPLITQRSCYRSLDGTTFAARAVLLRSSVPVHPECLPYGESLSAMDGHYPQPGPGGALYLMVSCGPHTFLAKSTDEALTFPVLHDGEGPRSVPVPPAPTPDFNTSALRVLADGTLVVVLADGGRLTVLVSGDEGRHWTRPVDVTAPGVTTAATWAVAARGHALALSYLGQHPGDGRYFGYVALLPDARTLLHGGTTVLSGQVAKGPLLYGSGLVGPAPKGAGTIPVAPGVDAPFPPPFDIQLFGNDFIGVTIGPDGTPWGSFTQDCGPAPSAPACRANGGQTRGLVGRLVLR